MRKVVFATTLLTLATSANAEWSASLDSAQKSAKKSGQNVLIHFYADWCGPCQKMETDVLSHVGHQVGKTIQAVKLNFDANRRLATGYGVTALPADVVLSPDGKVIAKHIGAVGLSSYVARINSYAQTARAGENPSGQRVTRKVVFPQETTADPVNDESGLDSAKKNSVAVNVVNLSTPQEKGATKPSSGSDAKSAVEKTDSEKAPASQESTGAETPSEPENTQPEQATKGASAAKETNDESGPATSDNLTTKKEEPAEEADSETAPEKPIVLTSVLFRDQEKRIGLAGFSPVSLKDGKWKRGKAGISSRFQGVVYRFRNESEKEQFTKAPETFIPVMHGFDPVEFEQSKRFRRGNIQFGVTYRNRLYFFTSRENKETFRKEPSKFTGEVDVMFLTAS